MGQELAKDVLREAFEIRDWFKSTGTEGQRKWMRMGKLLVKIRDEGYWKEDRGPHGERYTLFDDWIEARMQISKSKGYALLAVCDYLKLPIAKLEELGKSACYELARVGKEMPKSLPKVIARIEKESKDGPVSLQRIQTMVAVTLEGSHLPSGRYTNLDFLLQEERAGVVIKALKVIQTIEPLENSAGPAARGVHLISICEEYLSGEEQKKVVKQLEKAGAFANSNFILEE